MMRNPFHRTAPTKTCACAHAASAHEHYRSGDDCGFVACGCEHYSASTLTAALPASKTLHAA